MPRLLLLISDDVAVTATVSDALWAESQEGYRVECVPACADGPQRIAGQRHRDRFQPDRIVAVMVDLGRPNGVGLDTFGSIVRVTPNIPVLVLGSAADEHSARRTLQRGAQDYLLKERLDRYSLIKALDGAVERSAINKVLVEANERAQVMVNSMGDAVISTDQRCRVIYLNAVAEQLTGWSRADAIGRCLDEVFRPLDAATREPVANSMAMAIATNTVVNLAPNCILIRRDDSTVAVEDSSAPIRDRGGRVTGAVLIFRDVSDARARSQRLAYLAEHDGLTDLPNRARFNDRLVQALALAKRHQHKVAVLYLDIDRFKPINDLYGHDIGDKLLQSVARRLIECVRESDAVGRQGGDEFLILLSEVTRARDAKIIAEKIRRALAMPHQLGQHQLDITTSIGIANWPDDAADTESLVKQADVAMYCAKNAGGNCYRFFNPTLNAQAAHRHMPKCRAPGAPGTPRGVARLVADKAWQPIVPLSRWPRVPLD